MPRDFWWTNWLHSLKDDVKHTSRMMLRQPGFTAVAVLCLSLGIGANTAVFSVVNAVLFRPLPYPESDRLHVIWTDLPDFGHEVASLPDFVDWRARSRSFEKMTAAARTSMTLTSNGEPERVPAAIVASNFFDVLGVPPAFGRVFAEDEQGPGASPVVIVGDGLWRRRYGGAPSLLGTTIEINGRAHEVIGIAAPGFEYPEPAELWVPLAVDPTTAHRRSDFLLVVGRVKPDVTEKQAQDEMDAIARRLAEEYPDSNTGVGIEIVPMVEEIVGDSRPALLALWAAVGFVLVIACANVASLLLARGAAREREMSVRAALGAGRGRIVRQLLTESALLSLVGGGFGVLLATLAIEALTAYQPGNLPRIDDIALDRTALIFCAGASLVTGIVFGIFPSLQFFRVDLQESLKEGGRSGSPGRSHQRARGLLVIGETALAVILLIGAGLMARSFIRLQHVDVGIHPENLVTMRLSLTALRYPEDSQIRAFVDQLVSRIGGLPGVRSAGAMNALYLDEGGFPIETFSIEGNPPPPAGQTPDAHLRSFTPGAQRALGMRAVAGRGLGQQDGPDDQLVAVVNEAMVRRHFRGQNPVGRRVAFGGEGANGQPRWREIVGVVADVSQFGPGEPAYPEIQLPASQFVTRSFSLIVQTSSPAAQIANAVRAEVRALDPSLPIYAIRTMTELMGERVARPRFIMMLFVAFAIAACGLAAVGLYGLISYSVAQRRREVGVRVALEAEPRDILLMILRSGMTLASIGIALGVAGALVLSRYLSSLLFGVSVMDPVTYVGIAGLLIVVALMASYIPARRALGIAPVTALKE